MRNKLAYCDQRDSDKVVSLLLLLNNASLSIMRSSSEHVYFSSYQLNETCKITFNDLEIAHKMKWMTKDKPDPRQIVINSRCLSHSPHVNRKPNPIWFPSPIIIVNFLLSHSTFLFSIVDRNNIPVGTFFYYLFFNTFNDVNVKNEMKPVSFKISVKSAKTFILKP